MADNWHVGNATADGKGLVKGRFRHAEEDSIVITVRWPSSPQ